MPVVVEKALQSPGHQNGGHGGGSGKSKHYNSTDKDSSSSSDSHGTRSQKQYSGSESNKQSSKNLSHVPCKFFRQGACQAGDSCPFSHATDATATSQPCKYFQKGNCKFGMKCALAHITPDGQILNPHRNMRSKRRSSQNHKQSESSSVAVSSKKESPSETPVAPPAKLSLTVKTTGSAPASATSPPSMETVISKTLYYTPASSPYGSPAIPIRGPLATSPLNPTIWSPSSSPASFEHSRFRTASGSFTRSSSSAIMPLVSDQNNESAIDSDDEPDTDDVDYLPGSLTDLLTPQELKRRSSRPSFNSIKPLLVEEETPFVME